MRTVPRRWLIGLAAAHLLFVTLGAADMPLLHVGPIGRVLSHYSDLSGAGTGYGFFAPVARDQLMLHFDLIDHEGRKTTTTLETGGSREVDLRLSHVAAEFQYDDSERRRALATALAARMFTRNPEAREVVVRAEDFESVSMEEHRNGRTPRVTPVYQAKFKRGSR
ncbi:MULTISPECIES: hypothetical protein [Polyangium]|uniref:Uncharacterized protein n=2 Tax=Polyangium TaxID=55 RepID=A0A4U1INV8_9BACT|nr:MULTISPECIES: hypothetical protein [Polyangium]MDI1435041.1 hypothetical protein [Polyangium sorediatum]TKC95786.1 hypothetical protein E8A74_46570 [Polyangium fumosum]